MRPRVDIVVRKFIGINAARIYLIQEHDAKDSENYLGPYDIREQTIKKSRK